MQKKTNQFRPHPAQSIAIAVFQACCNTLRAMRLFREDWEFGLIGEGHDPDYEKEWHRLSIMNEPFIRECREHPVTIIDWDHLILNMNRLSHNERHFKDDAYRQKNELAHAARFHPHEILPLAVEYTREITEQFSQYLVAPNAPNFRTQPFQSGDVLNWLQSMDLLQGTYDKDLRAKQECFQGEVCLPQTGLSLETVRLIADWVTGPSGPPARSLHFHLIDSNGNPAMARDLLYVQGLSGPNETHVALLHVLPGWSEERRAILRDLILARWIRSVELYGYNTAFLSACTAGVVRRWQNLCKYLPHIPTVQVRPKGSSAGFNQP